MQFIQENYIHKNLQTRLWAKCIVSPNCPTYTLIHIHIRTRIHFRPYSKQRFGFVYIKELKERDVSITRAKVMASFGGSLSLSLCGEGQHERATNKILFICSPIIFPFGELPVQSLPRPGRPL